MSVMPITEQATAESPRETRRASQPAVSGTEPDPRQLSRAELAAYLQERATVSVPFAGAACGVSRAASYGAARDGCLKTLRLGHRLLVPTSWLEEQLGLVAGKEQS